MDDEMARNTGSEFRQGAIKDRAQVQNPVTKHYIKIDTRTGRIIEEKKSDGPYKGITDLTKRKK